MFFAYRAGNNRISNKAWGKLRSAEIGAGLIPPDGPQSHAMGEGNQADYRGSGSPGASRQGGAVSRSAEMVDPRFQPRPSPSTRVDVENYLRQYLDAAAQMEDPDIFPHVMRQLKKHFPLDEFESKDRSP